VASVSDCLLRRHVGGRAGAVVLRDRIDRAREAEVEQHDAAIAASDEEVGGLEIGVQGSSPV
jgi:hypothetical protein